MRYGSSIDRRGNVLHSVLLADYISPSNAVGEAVYNAVEVVARLVDTAVLAIRVRAEERRSIDALSRLDDRLLADIGVERSEIRRLAHKLAANPRADYR